MGSSSSSSFCQRKSSSAWKDENLVSFWLWRDATAPISSTCLNWAEKICKRRQAIKQQWKIRGIYFQVPTGSTWKVFWAFSFALFLFAFSFSYIFCFCGWPFYSYSTLYWTFILFILSCLLLKSNNCIY